MLDEIITLKDGRKLGFALYGPATGQPVLYFHGTPSSRLEPLLLNAYDINLVTLLESAAVRLIAVDRPGMGLSSLHTGSDFLSFALAMAYRFPQLVSSAFILCGFSSHFDKEVFNQMGFNQWYFRLAKNTPWLLKSAMNILRKKEIRR